MPPRLRLFWLAFGALTAMAGCGGDDDDEATGLLKTVLDRKSLIVATDSDYAPTASFDESTSTWQGFDIDVASHIAQSLGVTVDFEGVVFGDITKGNWNGAYDMLCEAVTITTERQAVLRFSDPYYYFVAYYATANGSPLTSFADLAGKTICVGSGSTYDSYLDGSLTLPAEDIFQTPPTGVTVHTVDIDGDCIPLLNDPESGVDVMLSSRIVYKDTDVAIFDQPVFVESLAIAVDGNQRVDSGDFLKRINKILAQAHSDGTLTTISNTYYGQDLTQAP